MNNDLVNKLRDAYLYFGLCQKYQNVLFDFECKKKALEKEYLQIKGAKTSPKLLNGVIIFFGISPVAILTVVSLSTQQEGSTLYLAIAAFIIGIVALVALNTSLVKAHNRRKLNAANRYWERTGSPETIRINREIENAKAEIEGFCKENTATVEAIPQQYASLDATAYMLRAAESGRAETMKEAMNLYEEELHRREVRNAVEDMQYEMIQHNTDVALQLNQIYGEQLEGNSSLRNIETLEFFRTLNNG